MPYFVLQGGAEAASGSTVGSGQGREEETGPGQHGTEAGCQYLQDNDWELAVPFRCLGQDCEAHEK